MQIKVSNASPMQFHEVTVQAHLPQNLNKLRELAYNLWWVWNSDAKNLFRQIDNDAWHRASSNPVLLLNMLGYDKLLELSKDRVFMAQLDSIYEDFTEYMKVPHDTSRPSVSYFSIRIDNPRFGWLIFTVLGTMLPCSYSKRMFAADSLPLFSISSTCCSISSVLMLHLPSFPFML